VFDFLADGSNDSACEVWILRGAGQLLKPYVPYHAMAKCHSTEMTLKASSPAAQRLRRPALYRLLNVGSLGRSDLQGLCESRIVRGRPKQAKRLLSPNRVIDEIWSSETVNTKIPLAR
jgi:hypothetical protein